MQALPKRAKVFRRHRQGRHTFNFARTTYATTSGTHPKTSHRRTRWRAMCHAMRTSMIRPIPK
nr:hypothetical protein SHINE37_60057 [Rhizobiaceae bacterium]